MSGTSKGGKQTAITNKARHGEDFYRKIGSMGGKASPVRGFTDRSLARRASAIGKRNRYRDKAEP